MSLQWLRRPEAGTVLGYKLISGFALLCGRRAARAVLYPITGYFLLRRGPERRASRDYLQRVLGTPVGLRQVARHLHHFAAITLDRVFLLSERFKRFDIYVHGLGQLRERWNRQHGVLIFGSHLGSFDALRVLGSLRPDAKVRVVIDLEQNPKLSSILNAMNPQLAAAVINARQEGAITALAIKEALDEKSLVTLLVDRARPGNQTLAVDFLGEPARLPTAPWLLAAALKAPVMLCFGLYLGGNRYELHFEPFADPLVLPRGNREQALQQVMQRFADRLAHHARSAPYNWFNFYDFWQTESDADPAGQHAADDGQRVSSGG
jgi:predicted LPLAT superfamily acyltransferase